jgi:hypothetical protein
MADAAFKRIKVTGQMDAQTLIVDALQSPELACAVRDDHDITDTDVRVFAKGPSPGC